MIRGTFLRPALALAFLLPAWHAAASAESCRPERQAVLPVTFNNHIPTIPVIINSYEVNMGVDTGAETSLIIPEAAARLHLPIDPRHVTNAFVEGGADRVNNVFVNSLELGSIRYGKKSIPVISTYLPVSGSSRALFGPSSPMAGLIGADILSSYDVEYDPPAHMLTLYTAHCDSVRPPWKGQYVGIKASLTRKNRFILPVRLNGRKLAALFDTGASSEKLAKASIDKVSLTPQMLEQDPESKGYGGNNHSYSTRRHRFDSLIIGRELYKNITLDVADIQSQDSDMLVGEDFMRTRRFWLSYSTSFIFVQSPPHPVPGGAK